MCREYKPTIVLNGRQKKVPVKCYITLPPLAAEPVLQPGEIWWQTLPPTWTRESTRHKRGRPSPSKEEKMEDENINQPELESVLSEKMQIDLVFDPWDDNRTRKLFLPAENEHPMDAIAKRIDLLIDA